MKGADPSIENNDGQTALDVACLNDHYTVTELLLKHKADPINQHMMGGHY